MSTGCYSPSFGLSCLSFISLKAAYTKNRARLSQTGQGLLDDDRADEIAPGSEIANVWGDLFTVSNACRVLISSVNKMKVTFPWYKRMHALMGANPSVTRASVGHSKTSLDLGILSRSGSGSVRCYDGIYIYY